MYKGGRIIIGLLIFLVILIFPFAYNLGKANAGPVIDLPSNTQCVEPASYMRENHMQLLDEWRNLYVRDGQTVYVNSEGKSFDINIDTCTKCHYQNNVTASATGASNPAVNPSDQFCVTCHNYASVKPTCWSCHNEPGGAEQ